MGAAIRTIRAFGSALSERRDLLVQILALRHQLGVLTRSDRRFRPSDRLFWLCLPRLWPRWREALVLAQPATVIRWRREGLRRYWSRRSGRRPGRPRIHPELRALIRRMANENRLWGAPRIHGELLKLGIAVSERTVSRYLADIRRAPSQTWRTFSRQPLRPADLHLARHVLRRARRGRRRGSLWRAASPRIGIRRTVVRLRSVVRCPLASVIPTHDG